jgi:hypothetical protein
MSTGLVHGTWVQDVYTFSTWHVHVVVYRFVYMKCVHVEYTLRILPVHGYEYMISTWSCVQHEYMLSTELVHCMFGWRNISVYMVSVQVWVHVMYSKCTCCVHGALNSQCTQRVHVALYSACTHHVHPGWSCTHMYTCTEHVLVHPSHYDSE